MFPLLSGTCQHLPLSPRPHPDVLSAEMVRKMSPLTSPGRDPRKRLVSCSPESSVNPWASFWNVLPVNQLPGQRLSSPFLRPASSLPRSRTGPGGECAHTDSVSPNTLRGSCSASGWHRRHPKALLPGTATLLPSRAHGHVDMPPFSPVGANPTHLSVSQNIATLRLFPGALCRPPHPPSSPHTGCPAPDMPPGPESADPSAGGVVGQHAASGEDAPF